jgi:lipoic acid synthetase
VRACLGDLRAHGVDLLTLGQYLQPTPKHLPVERFVSPDAFREWQRIAEEEHGFLYCASGPLVRSSYRAGEFFTKRLLAERRGMTAEGKPRQPDGRQKETEHGR